MKRESWPLKALQAEMEMVLGDLSSRRVEAEHLAKQPPHFEDPYYLADIASALEDLGSLASVGGALRILNNDPHGWADLERAFLWNYYEQRALKRLFDQDWRPARQPRSNPRDLAILTLLGLTFLRPEVSWCRTELAASLDGGPFGVVRTFSLATYALWLAQTHEVKECAPHEHDMMSVYREVAAAWFDNARLQDAMFDMCQYHVARTIDVDDSELWVEFEIHPYPVFPVEYLALARTREQLGLAAPNCDHPLLRTPLAQLPVLAGPQGIRGYEHLKAL